MSDPVNDMLARLKSMSEDDCETWGLSPNDKDAICLAVTKWEVLDLVSAERDHLRASLKQAQAESLDFGARFHAMAALYEKAQAEAAAMRRWIEFQRLRHVTSMGAGDDREDCPANHGGQCDCAAERTNTQIDKALSGSAGKALLEKLSRYEAALRDIVEDHTVPRSNLCMRCAEVWPDHLLSCPVLIARAALESEGGASGR